MTDSNLYKLKSVLTKERHIAPLAVLRISFGIVMLISTIRFWWKGWIYDFYIAPSFHFPFYGFEWLRSLPATGMYFVFGLMVLTALFITIGFLYRISLTAFFFCFLYVELLDKTYYLNHYYFVSILTFLLMLMPAHRYCSVDTVLRPSLKRTTVPAWMIGIFIAQLILVYFDAGLSKLTHDWLIEAMPLKIWLPANGRLPLIGPLLQQRWIAYFFSWAGAAFDLSICFLLLYAPTRRIAYIVAVVFHVLTAWLFKIGMFPYIMIAATVIFFPSFPPRIHKALRQASGIPPGAESPRPLRIPRAKNNLFAAVLITFFFIQLLLPFRYLLYPGTLFWTEEGYRFSWRVMLMEKSGSCFFYVTDPRSGRKGEVNNGEWLTPLQERMMATQPDMLLQYAHYLKDIYINKGIPNPVITVADYVTLNGSGSRLYIDSTVDLGAQQESFLPKRWILPFTILSP
jgi:hypothetical protein